MSDDPSGAGGDGVGHTLRNLLAVWFGSAPVGRLWYAATGFYLMALKYAIDAAFLYAVTGRLWRPLDYLTPLMTTRTTFLGQEHGWTLWALLAWTIPFVWIGASMTLRRGLDAGFSAWTGLLFFVPGLNYLWMLLLCTLPSREARSTHPGRPPLAHAVTRAIVSAAAPAAALGVAAMSVSVFAIDSYGAMLFVGTPFAMGFTAGYLVNRDADRGAVPTQAAAGIAVVAAAGALLLFALEGVICLAMAAPPAILLSGLGAGLGHRVACQHRLRPSQVATPLLAIPLLMGVETAAPPPPLREVASSIEIDAPPSVVWPHVVGFTELPPPSQLVFRLGIAYPMRARIEGRGVGAVRYCEFSTGPFVEPITAWDAPRRLSFDVARQPEPMHETSPYQHVHAPHLVDGLVSRRGEFRLVELPGGRTRLEGSTWYQLDMAPELYWRLYADALIGAIHQRVLAHVKGLAEAS
jgi:hypothetical protein